MFFKVERIKLRILRGKVVPNAAFSVASTRTNEHRKCLQEHLLYGRAESCMFSHSKPKLQVLKLLHVPKVRK
jgi:hypothetical protein